VIPFVFDRAHVVERLEGDQELLDKLIGYFRTDAPQLLEKIRVAVREQDTAALIFSAHRLSGLVRNFDARQAAQRATNLETLGRIGNLAAAEQELAALERELQSLMAALEQQGQDASLETR
jgi:HPt (histidine-containing phosphotransfer) domain-containing protein